MLLHTSDPELRFYQITRAILQTEAAPGGSAAVSKNTPQTLMAGTKCRRLKCWHRNKTTVGTHRNHPEELPVMSYSCDSLAWSQPVNGSESLWAEAKDDVIR